MALTIGELVGYVKLDTAGVKRGAAETATTMATVGKGMDRAGILAGKGWVQGADGRLRDARGKFVSAGEQAGAGLTGGLNKSTSQGLSKFSQLWKTAGGIGLGLAIKDSIGLEAAFGKTMAQIAASTGAPKAEMGKLNDLAMHLGAATSFSASEAAGAMLELSKAGIGTSDIMGGALSGTLTLAAAGGTDLATASTIASNAMNTFGLKGKDMASIAAALAGGANASSASVESLGLALSQVGPGATNAGFSLQETVGVLSAFDSAGIKGSDAGTSLKQMLANLVPQSKQASLAMESVGLWTKKSGSAFVNANGSFKSAAQIAGLLHDKLGHLSEAQRTQALTSIFGSDASRAATVLMKDGKAGIQGYIKATKDQTAAQKMAKANMSGTAGALERMKGSLETAGLALGKVLAPATVLAAGAIGGLANGAASATKFLSEHKGVAIALGVVIGLLTTATLAHNAAMGVSAAGGMAKWLMQTKLISAASKVWTAVQWALNGALSANPIALVVIGIAALIAAAVIAYKKVGWFRDGVNAAFHGIVDAAGAVVGFVRSHWPLLLAILTGPIGVAVLVIARHWSQIKSGASNVVEWIKGIPGKLGALGSKFGDAGRALLQGFVDGMKNAAGVIKGIAGNVWDAVKGLLNGAIDKINAALEFKISLPLGKSISINPPDIPKLATGGRATAATLAVIGEGREPESVLPDSVLHGLLARAHAAGAASAQGHGRGGDTWNVYGAPGMDENVLAERAWFLTRTRG